MIIIFLGVLKFAHLVDWNLPYVTLKSYVQYQNQVKSFNDFNNEEKIIQTKVHTDNDVIVIILGESATRKHMGIYGYPRETTPNLNRRSDSLIVYRNVISSHVYTTESIYDILTLSNYERPQASNSLLDYLKNSGYKVYWLSNQRPVGFHDNLVSRLASAADESFFLSYNDFRHVTLLDEVLLPKLNDRLSHHGKKVIFIHLIGNHYAYDKRYPEQFAKFTSEEMNKKNKFIDSYDNSILYNDFIVSEIIKAVDLKAQKSAVIYLSDHGEEVYDIADFFGHFADKPTSSMYEVPFLVFMSETFQKPDDFVIDESRAYMLDDFPHSLTHFMGIESELLDKDRSIFSASFKERKRMVHDSLQFETFKLNENR
ncbi:phosphoethanolamine transferase [Geojedonia litorea]|uniref:Phosphoethanolamine transferase n=1 Tax=Geojedonia litorea TaxID=1268269 RepID=A0ABV9N1T5_9FLAO